MSGSELGLTTAQQAVCAQLPPSFSDVVGGPHWSDWSADLGQFVSRPRRWQAPQAVPSLKLHQGRAEPSLELPHEQAHPI